MASTSGICNSFKTELLQGVHALATDTLKVALYTSAATLSPTATTTYSTSDEVVATGYTAGGTTITSANVALSSNTAYFTFANPSWANATITARTALIYNASKGNKAVAIFDFGSDVTSTSDTFTLTLPAATATTALIRFT